MDDNLIQKAPSSGTWTAFFFKKIDRLGRFSMWYFGANKVFLKLIKTDMSVIPGGLLQAPDVYWKKHLRLAWKNITQNGL